MTELTRPVSAVPDGWRSCKLGEVAVLGGGTTPSRAEEAYWLDAAIPWATPSDITSLPIGISSISQTESRVSDRAMAECSLPLNPPGTVLMTSRATIGFAAINAVPMATNQGFITFKAGECLDPAFLLHWLTASRSDLVAAAGGSTFKELSRGTAKLLPILLPPLDEQRRIAEVLRSVDEAIAAAQEVATSMARVNKTMRHKLLNVAADGTISELPTDWDVRPLEVLASVERGKFSIRPRNDPRYFGGATPFIQTGDITSSDGYIVRHTQTLNELGVGVSRVFRAGTIMTTIAANIGDFAIATYPVACPDSVVGIEAVKGVDAFWLYSVLTCFKVALDRASTQNAQKNINLQTLRPLLIPVPPRALMIELAETLSAAAEGLRQASAAVDRLVGLKLSIQADLLSGRVRVPAQSYEAARAVPAAFKRAVFAAEIVHQLHNDNRFGSVKHEKIVHLCELHLGLHDDLDRHAYKKAAGPYDPVARRSVEQIFRQQKWFNTAKPDGKRVVYSMLEKAGDHRSYYDRYFGEQKASIQSIIDLLRPLDTERCEIIATAYAVWNDFIIDGHQPSDEEIVASILAWHPRKVRISKDRWFAVLPWMRQQGLVPRGTGEKTRTVST